MAEILKSNLDSEKELEIHDSMGEYKQERTGLESEINSMKIWTESVGVNESNTRALETEHKGKEKLTKSKGVFQGPSGTETWYDLPMKKVVGYMSDLGYTESKGYKFRVRSDGVKMLGPYVMVTANIDANNGARKKGTIVDTSLGKGIVCDKCERAYERGKQKRLDIAVDWKNNNGA